MHAMNYYTMITLNGAQRHRVFVKLAVLQVLPLICSTLLECMCGRSFFFFSFALISTEVCLINYSESNNQRGNVEFHILHKPHLGEHLFRVL